MFLQMHPEPPEEIVLDIDATDNPLHGHQLGRFLHGYYGNHCDLPLYIFSGHHRATFLAESLCGLSVETLAVAGAPEPAPISACCPRCVTAAADLT